MEVRLFGAAKTVTGSCYSLVTKKDRITVTKNKVIKFSNFDNKISQDFKNCVIEFDNTLRVADQRKGEFSVHYNKDPITIITERNKLGYIFKSEKGIYCVI